MLSTLLREKMQKEQLSARAVAKQSGVSHMTVSRVIKGQPADLPTIIALCKWLNIRPNVVLGYKDDSLEADVAAMIQAVPSMEKIFREIVKKIKGGKASPELLKDIVSYADYKLKML